MIDEDREQKEWDEDPDEQSSRDYAEQDERQLEEERQYKNNL